jgi:uncharacterized zinc-type alcohol dehydrogenase-like protein
MTMNILGYAALSPGAALVPFRFDRRDLRTDDILVDILYCGICHSDLHHARNEWTTTFPCVPGHEIIGRVASVGRDVTRFRPGDPVGVGCMVDSCGRCDACARGLEQHCAQKMTLTYNDVDRRDGMRTFGGYSQRIVVPERFALKLPDGLDPKSAGPLLCAGITTWSPLRRWRIGKGSRVAVVGLGGLGHMAVKLAKALGAEVTLFSRSPHKADDARRLGADEIVHSTDAAQMAKVAGRFELIVDTIPTLHDVNPYVPTLAIFGTLVVVGYLGDLPVNTATLVMERKSIAGSVIGGIAETQELLEFCATHRIAPEVEMIGIQEIDRAFERMLSRDVKYRFVIDLGSLK